MKFKQNFRVGMRDIGLSNKISNYGILSFLEDVAINHSDTAGYGVKDIKTKHRAWMLLDWDLKVIKRSSYGEEIIATTWTDQIEKPTYYIYRNFEIFNEKNEIIATASSKWILFDTENNKIVKLDKDIISLYNPEIEKSNIQIEKLVEPKLYDSIFEYVIKRSDIDINKHMHNLNYLKLAYEALPEEVYNDEELNNVHIMYKQQIKLNDKVKCFYKKENCKHYITIKNENEDILHAIIELY